MAFQVYFKDIQKKISVPEGMTILEASEKSCIEIPYSCRKGDCGTCAIKRIEGDVQSARGIGLQAGGPEDTVLACVSEPASDLVCETSYQEKEYQATVVRVISRTQDTQSFHLSLAQEDFFNFAPGQFVTVGIPLEQKINYRCYSISSSCFEKNYLEITVKKQEKGLVSNHFFEHIQTGSVVSLKRPKGRFKLNLEEDGGLLLVGSGVGITPLMGMIRSLTDRKSPRKVLLLYGCRTIDDIIFHEDLLEIEERNPNFSMQIFLSQSGGKKNRSSGRIGEKAVVRAIDSLVYPISMFTCGPEGLMNMAVRSAVDCGVPRVHCHKESFIPPKVKVYPHSVSLQQMRSLEIFKGLSDQNLQDLQPNVFNRKFAPGEVIIREGEYGDSAYYILNGKARVYLEPLDMQQLGRAPKTKHSLWSRFRRLFRKNRRGYEFIAKRDVEVVPEDFQGEGVPCDEEGRSLHPYFLPRQVLNLEGQPVGKDKFLIRQKDYLLGDLSVLFRSSRTATVTSDPDGGVPLHALEIKSRGLRILSKSNPEIKHFIEDHFRRQSLDRFLESTDLFSGCDPSLIEKIIETVGFSSFKPHEVIQKEGNDHISFFILIAGFVRLSRKLEGKELNFDYLEKGDFIGASPSGYRNPAFCSATAVNHVQAIYLNDDLLKQLWEVESFQEKVLGTLDYRAEQLEHLQTRVSGLSLLNFGIENQLLNGESIMVINLDQCTRCDDCVQACADSHDGYPRFAREGKKIGNLLFPHSCMHCQDPLCMIGCPSGALFRSSEKGEVLINLDTCVGCGLCVTNCVYENIVPLPVAESVSPQGEVEYQKSSTHSDPVIKAMKCDLCVETGSPACVRACPNDALYRLSFNEIFKA